MKKIFVLILLSLFMVVGNVVAADLQGTWAGCMYCSDDYKKTGDSDPRCDNNGEYWSSEIIQDGDFFTSINTTPSEGEECGGVIDGNNIYMSCPETIAHGELKGKTLYIINHKPHEYDEPTPPPALPVYWGATCKGTATKVSD